MPIMAFLFDYMVELLSLLVVWSSIDKLIENLCLYSFLIYWDHSKNSPDLLPADIRYKAE